MTSVAVLMDHDPTPQECAELARWKTAWQRAGRRPEIISDLSQLREAELVPAFTMPTGGDHVHTPHDPVFHDMSADPIEHPSHGDHQGIWHNTVARYLGAGSGSILDIGAGWGRSKERLGANGWSVTTQEPCARSPVDTSAAIDAFASESFDVVTAFDVVEHAQDQPGFIAHMKRIARKLIVLTTPNWFHTGNRHRLHYREFTPAELLEATGGLETFEAGWAHYPGNVKRVNADELAQEVGCMNFCIVARLR